MGAVRMRTVQPQASGPSVRLAVLAHGCFGVGEYECVSGGYRFRFGSFIHETQWNTEHHEAVWGFLEGSPPLFGW